MILLTLIGSMLTFLTDFSVKSINNHRTTKPLSRGNLSVSVLTAAMSSTYVRVLIIEVLIWIPPDLISSDTTPVD